MGTGAGFGSGILERERDLGAGAGTGILVRERDFRAGTGFGSGRKRAKI